MMHQKTDLCRSPGRPVDVALSQPKPDAVTRAWGLGGLDATALFSHLVLL